MSFARIFQRKLNDTFSWLALCSATNTIPTLLNKKLLSCMRWCYSRYRSSGPNIYIHLETAICAIFHFGIDVFGHFWGAPRKCLLLALLTFKLLFVHERLEIGDTQYKATLINEKAVHIYFTFLLSGSRYRISLVNLDIFSREHF